MRAADRKRSVVILRHSPYGSGLARSAVDLALAMGAFDQDFDLLFMGSGVLQLLRDQDSAQIGIKNVGKALSSLPLFEVEQVYVDGAALQRHGLLVEDLVMQVQVLNAEQLNPFLNDADHLVSC